ncbi:MAG: MMPL family transporter, partial [Candidatus Thermoplasmatota archaeon]|nr:MMPL family transporter [Candidatus Thermoplasmatota archaeon]
MKISSFIIRRKKTVIILWAIIILAATPALLGYSHYITYSSAGAVNPNSESQVASQILEKSHTTNSSLVILVLQNPFLNNSTASRTLSMQTEIQISGITDLASTTSPFSAYASFISAAIGKNASAIAGLYNETKMNATAMYSFPSAFYSSWSSYSYKYDSIMVSAHDAGYNSSLPYEAAFVSELNSTAAANNVSGSESVSQPLQAVMSAILIAYNETYPQYAIGKYSPGSYISYQYLGLDNYSNSVSVAVADYLKQYFPATPDLVNATISGGNVGINYVRMYGLAGAPQFLTDQYVSSDRSAFIVNVIFSVPSGYVGKGDFEPSSNATPAVEKITSSYFGNSGMVTGNGAINQQIQQVTAKSAFIFGVLFVILAIAVAITLVSWKSAIVALIFVSLATALGYVSIFITGIVLHGVNYIVNYTLTAVAVGVSTDYLIYIASRYRQEIREGASHQDALS